MSNTDNSAMPISSRMDEPRKEGASFNPYKAKRGVTVCQERYADGFLEKLSLSSLARIRDKNHASSWNENGRVAVADNGDLLIGIVVKNGSGRSQVVIRLEHEEVVAKLAEMREKAKQTDGDN